MKFSIKPIKVNFADTEKADTVFVQGYSDNLQSEAFFKAEFSNSKSQSILGSVLVPMKDTDYENWDNSNESALEFVFNYLNIQKI